MPFVNERDKGRAVDYERDIILKNAGATGGSSTFIDIFELVWKGDVVRFFCHIDQVGERVKEDNLYKAIVIYRIYPFTLPKSLKEEETQVKSLISKTLKACGIYKICPFMLPKPFNKKETEVKALITEALKASGVRFYPEGTKSVSVEFYDTDTELWKIRKEEGRK